MCCPLACEDKRVWQKFSCYNAMEKCNAEEQDAGEDRVHTYSGTQGNDTNPRVSQWETG